MVAVTIMRADPADINTTIQSPGQARPAPRHWPISLIPNLVRDQLLKNVTRMVLKLGTGVLTNARKQLDPAQMEHLVAQIASQRKAGREVVVVTSGAVGAGMGAPGWEKRPGALAELQACAAVGQTRLMT